MREVWEVIYEKYFTFGKSKSADLLNYVKVRNAILKLCEENLVSPEEVLTFEVLPKSLPYAVSVVSDDVITSQYSIMQITESLFEARLHVLEVF